MMTGIRRSGGTAWRDLAEQAKINKSECEKSWDKRAIYLCLGRETIEKERTGKKEEEKEEEEGRGGKVGMGG